MVIARSAQVTGLAETFSANRKVLEASATDIPSTGGAVSAGQGVSASASPRSQDTHTLEGHRQTMAGVVPRLYQLLSNAVEADDARGLERENEATRPVVTQALRSVLHGASWLWVGDAFVPADQVRLLLLCISKINCNLYRWRCLAFVLETVCLQKLQPLLVEVPCIRLRDRRSDVHRHSKV